MSLTASQQAAFSAALTAAQASGVTQYVWINLATGQTGTAPNGLLVPQGSYSVLVNYKASE